MVMKTVKCEREGTERSNLLTVRNSERVKILAVFNQ